MINSNVYPYSLHIGVKYDNFYTVQAIALDVVSYCTSITLLLRRTLVRLVVLFIVI